jgi:glycosyltransferase involved in cell wall biosynthesis
MKTNTAIKLFVDAHVFDGKFQGTRTFIKELYSLLATNENIALYLGAYDIDNLKSVFGDAGNIQFIKYRSSSSFIRLLYEIPQIIKKYQIDYAHFQYITPLVKNCRFIVTTHDLVFNEFPKEFPFWYRLVKNLFFKTSAKEADILTTVSAYSKQSIEKYFGIDGTAIHIIPNGVSNLFFASYDKENAKQFIKNKFGVEKIILLVSRLEPRKNHLLLLQAFIELELYKQGYYLALLGWHENISNPAFNSMMNKLPENSKAFVFMYQHADDSDLLQFYRAAEVFVYPSKAEGFGIPPLEAAAVKIPVLCSNSSAMSDFTFFGNNHFDPEDYPLFKSKLAAIITSNTNNTELGQIAAMVQQRYNWNESAATLYQLIQTNRAHNSSVK